MLLSYQPHIAEFGCRTLEMADLQTKNLIITEQPDIDKKIKNSYDPKTSLKILIGSLFIIDSTYVFYRLVNSNSIIFSNIVDVSIITAVNIASLYYAKKCYDGIKSEVSRD